MRTDSTEAQRTEVADASATPTFRKNKVCQHCSTQPKSPISLTPPPRPPNQFELGPLPPTLTDGVTVSLYIKSPDFSLLGTSRLPLDSVLRHRLACGDTLSTSLTLRSSAPDGERGEEVGTIVAVVSRGADAEGQAYEYGGAPSEAITDGAATGGEVQTGAFDAPPGDLGPPLPGNSGVLDAQPNNNFGTTNSTAGGSDMLSPGSVSEAALHLSLGSLGSNLTQLRKQARNAKESVALWQRIGAIDDELSQPDVQVQICVHQVRKGRAARLTCAGRNTERMSATSLTSGHQI